MSALSRSDEERQPLLSPRASCARTAYTINPPTPTRTTSRLTSPEEEPSSSFSCRHCLTSYVPIEFLLLGYTITRVFTIALTGFYFFDQASHKYGNPSMDSLKPCGTNKSGGHPDRQMAENVQKEFVQLVMIGTFSDFLTAVIPTVFLGPAIDRVGRRVGFVLPLLGTVARAIVFLLVLGSGASVYYIYIGTVMEGLGGGFGTFFMTSFSAAADITTPGEQRALRICIIEAVQVLGSSLATFVAGQWRRENYTQPLILATAVGVLSLIYALWFWPETLRTRPPGSPSPPGPPQPQTPGRCGSGGGGGGGSGGGGGLEHPEERKADGGVLSGAGRSTHLDQGHDTRVTGHVGIDSDAADFGDVVNGRPASGESLSRDGSGNCPVRVSDSSRHGRKPPAPPENTATCCSLASTNVRRSWGVYFRSDSTSHPARRCVLALCFVSFLLTVAVNFSKPSVEQVFRMSELCWDAVKESEFESGWLVSHWVCILVFLHLLQHRFRVSDVYLAIVGCVSAICAPVVFSAATLPGVSERTSTVLVFVSAGGGTLARLLIPMLRSMSSSVVHVHEQGALFTSYACVELAGAALFDMAASQVYNATVHIWKGIIFVIMVLFFVVVMILLVVLSVVLRRSKRGQETERKTLPPGDTFNGTG